MALGPDGLSSGSSGSEGKSVAVKGLAANRCSLGIGLASNGRGQAVKESCQMVGVAGWHGLLQE
jgi:hypothetical protein